MLGPKPNGLVILVNLLMSSGEQARAKKLFQIEFGQGFPVFPIVSPKNVVDLDDALRAAQVKLMPEQVEYLKRGILWGADST